MTVIDTPSQGVSWGEPEFRSPNSFVLSRNFLGSSYGKNERTSRERREPSQKSDES